MKVPKKVIIILAVVIGVLMLLGFGFLLVRELLQVNASEAKLDVEKKTLKDLYDRRPFPSATNIVKEMANVALLDEWYQKLSAAMRAKQIEPLQMSPSQFKGFLQAKKNELIQLANRPGRDQIVDPDFGFGFEKYFSSAMLPEPGDVPRLAQQLRIIEEICRVLFPESEVKPETDKETEPEASPESETKPDLEGIGKVERIVRETFERAPDDSGSGMVSPAFIQSPRNRGASSGDSAIVLENKNAGVLKPDDLYTKFHFIIDFKAKEKAFWAVLNKLSTYSRVTKENEEVRMFVVVTGIDITKDGSDLESIKAEIPVPFVKETKSDDRHPALGKPKVPAKKKTDARGRLLVTNIEEGGGLEPLLKEEDLKFDQRIVCGPEFEKPLRIRLDLDVYRFRGE